jgi:hypothetical protein
VVLMQAQAWPLLLVLGLVLGRQPAVELASLRQVLVLGPS